MPQQADEPPRDTREPAIARSGGAVWSRPRRLSAVALLIAAMGTAGFLLAPASEGGRPASRADTPTAVVSHAPKMAYAVSLSKALIPLNDVRAHAGVLLSRATTPQAQAEAAQMLADAHEQAAEAVRRAAPAQAERSANAAIAAALVEIGRGYSKMASGARHENLRGFESGRKLASTATASLAAALARLHSLGYTVHG